MSGTTAVEHLELLRASDLEVPVAEVNAVGVLGIAKLLMNPDVLVVPEGPVPRWGVGAEEMGQTHDDVLASLDHVLVELNLQDLVGVAFDERHLEDDRARGPGAVHQDAYLSNSNVWQGAPPTRR